MLIEPLREVIEFSLDKTVSGTSLILLGLITTYNDPGKEHIRRQPYQKCQNQPRRKVDMPAMKDVLSVSEYKNTSPVSENPE